MADEGMTSDREAVCGTCGHGESAHQEQDAARGVRAYCANCTQPDQTLWLHHFIPAPVVPSDDECQACHGEGGGYVRTGANEWDALACDVCRGTGSGREGER